MVRQITVTFAALMLSGVMLSGCGTISNGAGQDIRINVAGAGEALCDVTQPGRRYRVYAPGTFRAMRSPDDMRIRCKANGNREQTVVLRSQVSGKMAYNIATLGLGDAWDAGTGALWDYPDSVLLDFSTTPPKAYPLPDYQAVFEEHPELMGMEQFRPGKAALGSDIGTSVPILQPRSGEEDNSMGIMMPSANSTSAGVSSSSSSSSAPAKPLPPILPPVAPTAAAVTTAASPGVSASSTTGTSSNTNGTTSTSKSPSLKLFQNKVGTSTLPSGNQ